MFDFLRGPGPHSPSAAVRHALERDGLLPGKDAPPALGVVESRGRYAGPTVRHIRVFDPARTGERALTIRSYRDLGAHPGLVLRTGRVEEDGQVFIDYRGPLVAAAVPVRARADRAARSGDERFVFPERFRADAR
jgi:hypothetical protein